MKSISLLRKNADVMYEYFCSFVESSPITIMLDSRSRLDEVLMAPTLHQVRQPIATLSATCSGPSRGLRVKSKGRPEVCGKDPSWGDSKKPGVT